MDNRQRSWRSITSSTLYHYTYTPSLHINSGITLLHSNPLPSPSLWPTISHSTLHKYRMWHKFSALHHFSRRTSTVFSRSLVFNLITVYTPVLLLAGSIVTSAKQILSPIHCEGEGKDGLSKDYVETYCYIEGTFNLYMKQAEQQVWFPCQF